MKAKCPSVPAAAKEQSGFTLTELVVVLGLLALLSVLILPALAAGRNNSRDAQCIDNKKRLAAGWLMYASENSDALMNNPDAFGNSPEWVTGDLTWQFGTPSAYYNTNTTYLTDPAQSAMAQYVRDASVFKCPADIYTPANWPVPRVRSVSMNGALAGKGGSGPLVRGHNPGKRSYYGAGGSAPAVGAPVKKLSELNTPGPTRTYLILDEHPDSINDGAFMLDPGPTPNAEKWRELPASYHDDNAVGICYADGRVEIHKWQEPYRPAAGQAGSNKRATFYPVTFTDYWFSGTVAPWGIGPFMVFSKDFEWMQDGMPYRVY